MAFDSAGLKEVMVRKRLTLAAAESLTCGRVQMNIGSASGASKYFVGGITVYDIDQKVGRLRVDRTHAEEVYCVSERVAVEMARGAALLFESDYAISTTGYAEPCDAAPEPFAHIAIWKRVPGVCVHADWVVGKGLSRVDMQQYVAVTLLTRLREHVESH